MSKEYEELKGQITSLQEQVASLQAAADKMIYNYIDENMPEWARSAVQWAVGQGIVQGTGDGLGLDDKDLRWLTMLYRLSGNN